MPVKTLGCYRQISELIKERIQTSSESIIELVDLSIVCLNLHRELHLLKLHSGKSSLKIIDVWELAEVVLELEDFLLVAANKISISRYFLLYFSKLPILRRVCVDDHLDHHRVLFGLRSQCILDICH